MKLSTLGLRVLPVMAAGLLAACASMGRPQGGPRDMTPPVYVRSNPAPGQLNVSNPKIVVEFDENVSIDDAMNKVVVSPAQRTTPAVSSLGKRITVELRDSLIPNTTYTIDFSDAIRDLNESNVLDGFAMDFATGDSIDSLRISGMVFDASNLEPAQGMLVGAYSNLSDTAITTLPLERITKTNQLGQFTLRNLKPGQYHIFALNDMNRDYHWDRSEDVAFYGGVVTPTSERVLVSDTLKAADGTDSVVTRPTTRFLPDDLLLTWFNEQYKSQYLVDNSRPERRKLDFRFNTRADSLPILKLINTSRAGEDIGNWAVLDASATLDTLSYWIKDTALVALDTLLIEATYMRTDTLDNLSLTTDTLRFIMRGNKKKSAEEKKKKKDEEADTVAPPVPTIDFRATTGSTQELNLPLLFSAGTPVLSLDSSMISMEMLVDTLWTPVTAPVLSRTSPLRPMNFVARYTWEPGTKYRLTIDSAAISDIYGLVNKQVVHEFTTKNLADYSSVTFNVQGLGNDPAVVELLNTSDKAVASAPVRGGKATLDYIAPGTYYARLYIDRDSNNIWSTGNLLDSVQPEDVFYYPKKLTLKKNWDIDQTWDIYETPVDMQKPLEIKKNKPKKNKFDTDDRNRNTDDEDEEDEFFDDPFMNAATRGNSNYDSFENRRR